MILIDFGLEYNIMNAMPLPLPYPASHTPVLSLQFFIYPSPQLPNIVGKEFLAISDTMKPFIVKRVKHLSIATLTNEDTCMYYREFFSSPESWKTAMP